MSGLRGLSPRMRALVVAAYVAAAAGALLLWWTQLWSNVVADGVVGAPSVVAASGLLARRVIGEHVADKVEQALGEHREQIAVGVAQQLAEHHEAVATQIDRALATQPPQDGGQTP